MVQETHWGLGKTEGKWRIGTCTAIVSPDSKSRYAGVATFVSSRIAEESQISHNVCLPGRILHVRCEGARTRLDIVNCYQWVWQDKQAETVQKNRSHFWSKLGGLLHSLPVRNTLLLGADFNSKLRPVAGLVGRGLMKSSQGNETELEAILQTHNLVLANTWTSSRPSKAHTFRNGATMSQLDFLATRRLTVDAEAKKSAPVLLDLVPWRKGPKHRPVSGSFKWVAGWSCAKKKQKSQAYSKQDLREHLAANTDRAQVLRSFVQGAIAESRDRLCFRELNRVVLRKCVELFPAKQVASDKPRDMPQVQQAINSMWLAYEQLRAPLPTGQFQRASVAVSRQLHFQKASREMKQHSRQARKQWLLDKIVLAEQAAQKKDYAELYRIINKVAPKKRREQVRIRSRDGGLLTKQQEFAEIFDYFSKAFKSGSACIGTTPNCLVLSREEVTDALSQLKRGKAVPTASVPAEVWQTCPDEYADALSGMLSARANHGLAVPSEISHCELSLKALAAALDMAGVSLALRDAIVSLHNACKYAVKHHVHSAEFPMEMGVRQGCTLAPTLYSLFTALFWRQLAQCTTPEWADSCVTMFADDKHMFWSVESAAAQNRHRLLKFLHGKMLSLQERVRLYNACVRSALLYGLHVVGLTGASARTLDSSDMRSLRAIAKSPAHLSRESNTALRRRLHIDSAVEAVQRRVQRKTAGTMATNDTEWYAGLQASLEEIMKYVDASEPVHLSRDLFPGVAPQQEGLRMGSTDRAPQADSPGPAPMTEDYAAVARKDAATVFGEDEDKDMPQQEKPTEQEDPWKDRWHRAGTGEQTKWPKAQKGQYGGKGSWSSWTQNPKRKHAEPEEAQGGVGELDQATKELIGAMTRMSLRHEAELARLKQDTGFMLFIDTADYSCLAKLRAAGDKWQTQYANQQVTTSLKVVLMSGLCQLLRRKVEELQKDEANLERLMKVGWLSEGRNALDPVFHFYEWSPSEKKELRSTVPPIPLTEVLGMLDTLEQNITVPGVLTQFKSTRQWSESHRSEVMPFQVSLSLRHEEAHRCHRCFVRLSGNSAMKLLGARLRLERGQRSNLAREVEDAYRATSYCNWGPRRDWQKPQSTSQTATEGEKPST
ncbi:Kcnh5 [Symbiodinium sp. CCMP2456]|nr:Kcnh5 [Symbiodinium sp. CCMP2456]